MSTQCLQKTDRINDHAKSNHHFLKVISLTFLMCFCFGQYGISQSTSNSYKTAIGVKFYPTGVTLKTFVMPNAAFEAIGYFWDEGTRITALYEYHHNLSANGNLKWYIGPGAHVGFYKPAYFDGGTTFGVDGVLGLDYKFPGIPINVSLDWQPSYEFGDYAGFSGDWGGIGLCFAF